MLVLYKAGYTLLQGCIRISIGSRYFINIANDRMHVITRYYTFGMARNSRERCRMYVEMTARTFAHAIEYIDIVILNMKKRVAKTRKR